MTRPFRTLFWICCAWAIGSMWLSPHLPQVDLPQHAGQAALLRDIALGHSPWPDELRTNLLTPYLIGYLSLLLLSFVMSIESAIALVYSLTFVAFVAACISLRRQQQADERLDWLFVPVFFGLSWQWGFMTFLGAAPIGIYFLTMSYRFTAEPTAGRAAAVVGLGVALLFAHGLVFLYAVPIGLLIALTRAGATRPPRWWTALPYIALLLGFGLYKVTVLDREMGMASGSTMVIWGDLKNRLKSALVHPVSSTLGEFPAAPFISIVAYAAPWLLGLRPKRGLAAKIPFLWTLGMTLFYPIYLWGATNFYDRFAFLLLPTYAIMFERAPVPASGTPQGANGRRARVQPGLVMLLLLIGCVLVLARETTRNLAFAGETRDADRMFARMAPNKKVLYVPMDTASRATNLAFVYLHYAVWYQARRDGLVEFNFATLLPQVVRYRNFKQHVDPEFSWNARERMRWQRFENDGYGYVVFRSFTPLAAETLAGTRCPLVRVETVRAWSVYKNSCIP
jgi:hypothetical protein